MTKTNLDLRKLVLSPLVFFIVSALVFGITNGIKDGKFLWGRVIAFGVPFGLITTALLWRQLSRLRKSVDSSPKTMSLQKYLANAQLPTDPKLLRAMPAYLDKREKGTQVFKKQMLPIAAIFVVVLIFSALSGHNPILVMVAIAFAGLYLANYGMARRTSQNIAKLRKQLK